MSEAKYTPGPWVQMGTSIGVTKGEIASLWDIDGRVLYNARLIAAAPELLEALSDLLASISGGEKSCGHAFTCICPGDKARAAIAKALGEQA